MYEKVSRGTEITGGGKGGEPLEGPGMLRGLREEV